MSAVPEVPDRRRDGERDGRDRLVTLYAALAAHTEPECMAACPRPMTCCAARYCAIAIDFAAEHWDVDLEPTWHRTLPLMGPRGCVAEPHLRPICTAHTCAVCTFGEKPGDPAWTERYNDLRDAIAALETELLGQAFV
ncbi:MAG: hypothetical protein ACK4QW_14835 [Alphaproteobacteria bacterium]